MSRFQLQVSGLRQCLLTLALLFSIIALGGCKAEGIPLPNLILITTDGLAANQLACFGGPVESGKSLCRLGAGGTLFGWTMATGDGAAAAAASMLTGLPRSAHGVDNRGLSFLNDVHETIAERLAGAGYATAAFIESPALNRSRRLDQGFDHYDDHFYAHSDAHFEDHDDDHSGTSVGLADRIGAWTETARVPRFVWIHLGSHRDLAEIDRLVARMGGLSDPSETGVLFASLRGRKSIANALDLSTHRVPMIWRAPASSQRPAAPRVSFALASLTDIAPTLIASARLPVATEVSSPAIGRVLDDLGGLGADVEERFLLLEGNESTDDVGLASKSAVYLRSRNPLEDLGQPVPISALVDHRARFWMLPASSEATSAELAGANWRRDVLSADSPVPRLEFHLSRLLKEHSTTAPR